MGSRRHHPTTRRGRPTARALVVGVLLVLTAACGDDVEAPPETASPTPIESSTDDGTASPSPSPTPSESPTSDEPSASPTDDTALPGEPWDGFAADGDVLAVVGVAHDDVLNIREVPGTDGEIVATAAPTDDDLVATGRARQLPSSSWYEVTVDGVTGWASVGYLAFVGGTDDATAAFIEDNERIRAETMQQLGEEVAAGFASTEPASRIVQSVAPTVGDLGEVTYDVIGLGDDAVLGFRLHVFGTPDEGGEGFVLRTIERTTFCARGSDGELCT